MRPAPGIQPPPGDLPTLHDLQQQFPGFAIWRDVTGERVRYVAQRAHPGVSPHTVVCATTAELRAELAGSSAQAPPARPCEVANVARMYDYWLGGKDNYATDREAASKVTAQFPEVARVARANRAFVARAVAHVAAQGITQFVDVGAGLPTSPNVHEVARRVTPAARVAYVDRDPIVLAHARALLATSPGIAVVPGDMRDPHAILASSDLRSVIDLARPVCFLLASVLHFLDPGEADALVAALTGVMVPGSYLIISAGTSTGTDPALIGRLRAAYAGTTIISARTEQQIAAWFTGLHLVPPGLVDVRDWRPALKRHARTPPAARFLGGLAHKPVRWL